MCQKGLHVNSLSLFETYIQDTQIRAQEFDRIMKDKRDFPLVLELRTMGYDWNRPTCQKREEGQTPDLADLWVHPTLLTPLVFFIGSHAVYGPSLESIISKCLGLPQKQMV